MIGVAGANDALQLASKTGIEHERLPFVLEVGMRMTNDA